MFVGKILKIHAEAEIFFFLFLNKPIYVRSNNFFRASKLFSNRALNKHQIERHINVNTSIARLISGKNMASVYTDDIVNLNEKCSVKNITPEDLNSLLQMLKEILEYGRENNSWLLEGRVKILCQLYKCLSDVQKKEFLQTLAGGHAVNHNKVYEAAKLLSETDDKSSLKILKTEDRLRNLLKPGYLPLFLHIGKLENGVKFLVDLRTDVLDFMSEKSASSDSVEDLHKLNATLRDLLSLWFSVGFLELERITWKSSCEMLQKISEYEAVHPIRNWADLKRRVGAYRRCFIFLHRSMPGEPIVVLHTALTDKISSSLKEIVLARSTMLECSEELSGEEKLCNGSEEDPKNIKAAVFYSISSSQKGLKGIELGNYLIKGVVRELRNEFPQINQFSSLSPIPLFRAWLLERLKNVKRGYNDVLFEEEILKLQKHFGSLDFLEELRRLFITNGWVQDSALAEILEVPLMRLTARYLYLEKRRGFALDSVANFHLKNGAVMWRLNWGANFLPRGLSSSCGIMVNYRYFLEETEIRSIQYLEEKKITASESIVSLAESAKNLMDHVKKSKL